MSPAISLLHPGCLVEPMNLSAAAPNPERAFEYRRA